MEDEITVGIQLLLEDGVSDKLAAVMSQLAAADDAIAATSASWDGLDPGGAAPLSPMPILRETSVPRSPDTPVPDFIPPDLLNAPRGPQSFAAPFTAPVPFVPLDEPEPPTEAPPPSYAPMPTDIPATGEPWPDLMPKPSDFVVDPAPMLISSPSAPFEGGYAGPALPPDAVSPTLNFSILPAAPIPTEDGSIAPVQPSDPAWQASPPAMFAPWADSVAPTEAGPAAATPSAPDLTPSGGGASEATATAPLADAGGGEGQLMLDGSLLGRWVIEHLSREADRPPAGGTAFDPRQGR